MGAKVQIFLILRNFENEVLENEIVLYAVLQFNQDFIIELS